MNGKPFFKNQSGCLLYAFSSGSSASSWNLDDRDQNGSNDWYRGGWTRAPPDGSLPLGVRRWVGVGKLSLSPTDPGANANTGSVENEDLDSIDAEFPEYDQQLSDLLSEFDSALNYFEGKVTSGLQTKPWRWQTLLSRGRAQNFLQYYASLLRRFGKRRHQGWKTS